MPMNPPAPQPKRTTSMQLQGIIAHHSSRIGEALVFTGAFTLGTILHGTLPDNVQTVVGLLSILVLYAGLVLNA